MLAILRIACTASQCGTSLDDDYDMRFFERGTYKSKHQINDYYYACPAVSTLALKINRHDDKARSCVRVRKSALLNKKSKIVLQIKKDAK